MSFHLPPANLQSRFRRQIDHKFRPVLARDLIAELDQRNDRSSALTPDLRERRGRTDYEDEASNDRSGRAAETSNRSGPSVKVMELLSDASDAESESNEDSAQHRRAGLRTRDRRHDRTDRSKEEENGREIEETDSEASEDEQDEDNSEPGDYSEEEQDAMSILDEATEAIPSIEGISGRSWEILHISGARDIAGLEQYEVCWAPSSHPSRQVEPALMQDGQRAVWVENDLWPVLDTIQASPDDNREDQTVIEWAPTWHSIWDLRSALMTVARYHQDSPPKKSARRRIVKTDLSKYATGKRTMHDPEPEGPPGSMQGLVWIPEEGIDYTKGLLRLLERALKANRKALTQRIVSHLNMPARQQLTFRPEFVASGTSFNAQRPLIATTYIVGLANKDVCDHCKSGAVLPFPKCVTLPKMYHGACVNCSYTNRTASCKHREENRVKLLDIPESLLLADEGGDEGGTALNVGHVQLQADVRGSIDETQENEWYITEDMPIRARSFPPVTEDGNVLPCFDDDGEIPFEELAAALDEVTDALPEAPHSSLADETSSSSPSRNRGILESSQEVDVRPDVSLSSQHTSPSSSIEADDTFPGSSPAGRPAELENACRKRRRGSEPAIGPSQKRRCPSDLLESGDQAESSLTGRAPACRSPSRESTSSLEILPDPMVDPDAPLIDRVIVRDTFSHPECGHWWIRCKHPIIGCADPGGMPPSNVAGFVSINIIKVESNNDTSNRPAKQTVFNDEQFEAGNMTEAQVQYILSRCKCRTTQLLHDAWEAALREDTTVDPKWAYLSNECSDELNAVIAKFCLERDGTRDNPIEL